MSSARPKRGSAAPGPPVAEPEEAPLDVAQWLAEERHRQTEARLQATQAAYDALCGEHAALQERRRAEEAEAFEAAGALRRELAARAAQLAAAQAEVGAAAARLAEAQAAAEAHEAAAQEAFAAERAAAAAVAAELQAKLDALADFEAQREAVLAEVQRLRADNAYIAEEAGTKVRALQRRLKELQSASEAAPQEGEGEEGGGGGGLCLEADLARLLAHSRKAAVEMQQYGKEAEELQAEMRALEAERAGLLRDVALKEEMEAQYAKRGTLQAREIRTAHSKITSLEKGMVRMAADFEAEKAALEQGLRAQLAEATAEAASLRRLLGVRTKELRGVRRLAQEVLLQRSDVEAFLVSSIQQVRAEIAAGPGQTATAPPAAAAGAEAGRGPGAQPERGPSAASQSQGRSSSMAEPEDEAWPSATDVGDQAGDASLPAPAAATSSNSGGGTIGGGLPVYSSSLGSAVDVRDLSWPDRERVLRLLFSKINRAAAAPPPAAPVPSVARAQALSEVQAEAPLPRLRGLAAATEAGPAGLA